MPQAECTPREGTNFRNEALFPLWRGRLSWRERAQNASARLHETFPGLAAVVRSHPFERFESIADGERGLTYIHVPARIWAYMKSIPAAFHPAYLCALLLWQMDRFETRFPASGLDSEFALHYADSFNRMIDQITANPEFAALDRDAYLKDLWIARVVMVPALAQIWWPHSGLSLRQLTHGGVGALAHCFLRCGGRRPFLEGHTHDPMVSQRFWNAEGWAETLRLAALALSTLSHHKGAFSAAWYFDPAIQQVSPRLSFAAELQVGRGARRFRVGSNDAAIANATAKSMTRRSRHAAGTYTPTDYCIVWARGDLISTYGRSN